MKNLKNRFLVLLALLFTGSSLASATKHPDRIFVKGVCTEITFYCQNIKISTKQNSSKRIFGRLAKTSKSTINQK